MNTGLWNMGSGFGLRPPRNDSGFPVSNFIN
jgi:hypothetical protein